MVIDFKNINIKDIEGKETTVNIAKDLAKVLYNTAVVKEGLDIAKDIYNNGEVEVDINLAKAIKQLINGNFLAVVQEALNPVLDSIIDSKTEETKLEEPSVEEINPEQYTESNY